MKTVYCPRAHLWPLAHPMPASRYIREAAPATVAAAAAKGGAAAEPEALLRALLVPAPLDSVGAFVAMRFAAAACAMHSCVPHAVRQQVQRELHAMPLYQVSDG